MLTNTCGTAMGWAPEDAAPADGPGAKRLRRNEDGGAEHSQGRQGEPDGPTASALGFPVLLMVPLAFSTRLLTAQDNSPRDIMRVQPRRCCDRVQCIVSAPLGG